MRRTGPAPTSEGAEIRFDGGVKSVFRKSCEFDHVM